MRTTIRIVLAVLTAIALWGRIHDVRANGFPFTRAQAPACSVPTRP